MSRTAKISTALLIALAAACGDDFADGDLSISVYGEDFIEVGIPAGEMVDGWAVTFDRFDVDIGEIEAGELMVDEYQVIDLAAASGGEGTLLGSATVAGGGYDDVSYRIRRVEVDGSATLDDVTKTFSWVFDVPTTYAGCEGTAVVDGAPARLELTIHGDHLFYDDLVSSEPNVAFDLVAAADADNDGAITEAELAAIDITGQERYQVGNFDVEDLWGFIDQQVSTLGHIDGEGHCGEAIREP
jgi:hypothetical protein